LILVQKIKFNVNESLSQKSW